MSFAMIVDNFLRGDYPFPMMLFTVIIAAVVVVFLSKSMLGKLNIATKTDITRLGEETKTSITQLREETKTSITQLREETKADIAQLRGEMKHGFQQLKENDLYHTNKAMLIMAKALIPDQNVYERVKDSIMENTPDRLREDIRLI
jgi:hypothetical protein